MRFFMAHKEFCFVVSGLKIIGHANPDSNLESIVISEFVLCLCCPVYVTALRLVDPPSTVFYRLPVWFIISDYLWMGTGQNGITPQEEDEEEEEEEEES
jgi:hypothetical protein